MSNEIKVGDKVRVREDAPKIFFNRSVCYYPDYIFEVREVEDGNANIYFGSGKISIATFVLPLKYLVKVEDEAKEPKFKVGDWVKMPDGDVAVIVQVNIGSSHPYDLMSVKTQGTSYSRWSDADLEPYTEPTEEKTPEVTRKSPSEAENGSEMNGSEAETTRKSPSEKKYGSITIPVKVDLTDSYWDAYTADLAKEVALKVANKYNDPKEVAEYAVSVAKAVAEGLKRK